jgi:hypothetical protein
LDVVERPCTLIVDESSGLHYPNFQEDFTEHVPSRYGIPVRLWSLSPHVIASFDQALQELKNDLRLQQQPVFVATGPVRSWIAQFYLESLPLAGLVMVDPLPLDDAEALNECIRWYESEENSQSDELRLIHDYAEHFDHWTLRLEPGAVPMLVLSTKPDWLKYARATAERHSSEQSFGPVPVRCTDQTGEGCVEEICEWIHERVL